MQTHVDKPGLLFGLVASSLALALFHSGYWGGEESWPHWGRRRMFGRLVVVPHSRLSRLLWSLMFGLWGVGIIAHALPFDADAFANRHERLIGILALTFAVIMAALIAALIVSCIRDHRYYRLRHGP